MKKELICVVCPIGCHINVDIKNNYKVEGNLCARGETYGKEELTNPVRVVTSTIKIKKAIYERVPIKTDKAIPKHLIFQCMDIINKLCVESPVEMGNIVYENILNTGANIIVTRNM